MTPAQANQACYPKRLRGTATDSAIVTGAGALTTLYLALTLTLVLALDSHFTIYLALGISALALVSLLRASDTLSRTNGAAS